MIGKCKSICASELHGCLNWFIMTRKYHENNLFTLFIIVLLRLQAWSCTSTQAHAPLMLYTWVIMHANVNFCSPVKLFCFQNTSISNESLIIYGNNPLWSREEKEAILEHAIEIYMTSNRQKKVSQPNQIMSVRNIIDVVDEVHATLDEDESSSEDSEFELFQEEFESNSDWSNILTFQFLLLL